MHEDVTRYNQGKIYYVNWQEIFLQFENVFVKFRAIL